MTYQDTHVVHCEEVLKEHYELQQLLKAIHRRFAEVEAELKGGSQVACDDQLRDQIAQFQTHLTRHFHLEEEGGYLREALERVPNYGPSAAMLKQQHQEFLDRLSHLRAILSEVHSDLAEWKPIQENFEQLTSDLLKHESHENEILQAAFQDDLGGGD